jgi:hypothetical protein
MGDPFTVSDDAAALRGLPRFRRTIPVFHGIGGLAAVISRLRGLGCETVNSWAVPRLADL